MQFTETSLVDEARKRYLNYALSVITSRALPDVRDGLKPVQRRILYAMLRDLHLRPEGRYVKSARVVGEVMGKYHPHGDTAIYDALARMAQGFTLRAPLVDGRGNFGSEDGDPPAAMRYTEAKLQKLALELLSELGQKTVAYRPNYDGQTFEPVVLPARFPNLLVNGSQGIAVGMATSIPPHNLGETINACVAIIDAGGEDKIETRELLSHIRGPDFPTGGHLVASKKELLEIYEHGHGSLKLRGEWRVEQTHGRGNEKIIIKSVPYTLERRVVVEKIAEVIIDKKLPALLDVRDESAEDCRIVLEHKRGADPELIMAYLYKNTPLSVSVQFNFTCLVPTAREDISTPERVGLKPMLAHFLKFRMEVTTRRLEHRLGELERRIHVLEGFDKIFDALDATIRLIRQSEGKEDAAEKIQKKFGLSAEQVDAILELKLYRLAKLEILVIRKELEEKREEAERIRGLLSSKKARWALIRGELSELRDAYLESRRTKVSPSTKEPEFEPEAFIVDEDAYVLLTKQGWIKRQGKVKDLSVTRVREGDEVQDVIVGSTRSSVAFFSTLGSCYVCRLVDVPATTGYGNPIQTLFKLADGERIVKMMGFDPRTLDVPEPTPEAAEPERPFALAVTQKGMATAFSLTAHRDPSTRSGRKFMRLTKDDEVLYVAHTTLDEKLACATFKAHALLCMSEEVPVLSGPGKGVRLIRLGPGDRVVAARLLRDSTAPLVVEKEGGKPVEITVWKTLVKRGGKGTQLFKRGHLTHEVPTPIELPEIEERTQGS